MRVVVVGHGMAGSRLVREVRARDPQRRLRLTVFGAEPGAAYNRVLLSEVLAGTAAATDIALSGPGDADPAVDLRTGVAVLAVDRAARTVRADDGSVTRYDVLVLATGSQAWVPELPGLRRPDGSLLPGCVAFRTVEDCRRILELAGPARRAVVLGGGLLGLEAARGLAARGLAVDVVHAAPHLMERQLDGAAGGVLCRTLDALGVRVHLAATTAAVSGGDRVRAVVLDTGRQLPADLLVVACGVRPETALARAAGLEVDRGVVVDDRLRSPSDPRVYAVGECAQHDGCVYGLVAPAWEQVRVLADLLTGANPAARYTGSRQVTRLKAAGVDLATMGETHAGDEDAEVLSFADSSRGTYKKVVIRDERLVGAILLGEIGTVGTVTRLFDRGGPVPQDRLALLFSTPRGGGDPDEHPARIPDRATVCRCNGVTKGAVTACWAAGARDVEQVAAATRATTGCGGCRPTVEGLLDWLAAAEPDAADTAPRQAPDAAADPVPA